MARAPKKSTCAPSHPSHAVDSLSSAAIDAGPGGRDYERELLRAGVPADFVANPGALVGKKIRRSTTTPHCYTPWAQVVMTVPSRDGLCWLVTFIDGDVDVWRVDDPRAHYQFNLH
jgi:hypothetical protein